MSIDATRWAWKQQGISPTQKLVLLSMADRAGEDHTCWPSITRLVQDTGFSDRTIQKAIAGMEAIGLVRRIATSGKVNRYLLLGVSAREAESMHTAKPLPGCDAQHAEADSLHPRTTFTPEADSPPNDVHHTPEAGSPHPRTSFTPPPNDVHPESLRESLREPVKNRERRARARTLDAPPKKSYGEGGNVLLTDAELEKLQAEYGAEETAAAIEYLDQHIGARRKGDPYRSHYMAMRKWVFAAVDERRRKQGLPLRGKAPGMSFDARLDQARRTGELR